MEKEKDHNYEDCNCEHHDPKLKEGAHSHSCPTSKFVENLLKNLEIKNENKQD